MNAQQRIEKIYEFVSSEMKKHEIEPTEENILSFLLGMQEAWKENSDANLEKVFYQMALTTEIMKLTLSRELRQIMK